MAKNCKNTTSKFIGLSLFSSAGVAELNLAPYIDFKVANELIPIRCKVHEFWHPNTEMIVGDITENSIKQAIIEKAKKEKVNFVLATPPCQGVSLIGKNKRNDVKMYFPYDNGMYSLEQILNEKYKGVYSIDIDIYNAADYGVPQSRRRMIAVLCKKGFSFTRPKKVDKQVTVRDAIGGLPSLESGQTSELKHHSARVHTAEHIEYMQHTPTGKSAFQNEVFFPRKSDGTRITGYPYTYKRIDWDRPAPTITMRSDTISSTHSVHPGRLLPNGLYSDARVLTLRELFILSSIDPDIDLPSFASDSQIRYIVGEAVPPLLMESICKNIKKIE